MSESIWKKEVSFKRKAKETPPETDAPEQPDAAPSGDVPFWKKEISLSRKPKGEKQPKAEKPQKQKAPKAEKPKREKQPKAPKAQKLPKEPRERAQRSGDDVPFWKKEVSFSRKSVPAPAPEAPVAAPEPAAVEEESVADVAERIAPWVAAAAEAAARASVEAVPDERADEEETVEVDAGDAWTQEPELPPAPEPDPEPVPLPPAAAAAPAVEVEAPAVEPEPATPAVAAATPRAVVNPPVPAAELPPLDDEKPKPFWKRELGRKKDKETEPKAERKPKRDRKADREAKSERKAERVPKLRRERAPKKTDSKVPKRLVGLKVGASQLAAARVSNNGSAELVQVARDPLEPGVVVGGELRDPEALTVALKEFFQRHKLPRTGVRLGIANNRIGVRTFEIVGIEDPKQLANAIKFRAQEALPIPIEDAVLDYHVLSVSRNEEGQLVRRVLLVVAYRELVDRYVDACRKAGLKVVGIDLEAFALLRALAAPQDGAGGDAGAALVAVSIGHERSTFAVSDGRTCEFTRVLEWGGAALNVALARELNAAPSEVEDLKRSLSLLDESVPEGLTDEQAAVARESVRKQVQTFARELVSSLQFYQSQPGSLGIGEIVLTGGTAHLHGLAEELQRLIGVRVRLGDPLARVKLPKKFDDPEQLGSLAIAIGLGIDD